MRLRRSRRRPFAPLVDRLEDIALLSGATTTVLGLTPTQVSQAYGLNLTTFSSGGKTVAANGSGQTIAIVDAYNDPNLQSDLNTFDAKYGLAATTLSITAETSATDDGWAGEETLDVEWVHAIAPGATIDVIEAKSDSLNDLIAAVDVARNLPGVSVVSMSWGSSEFRGESSYDSHFTTPTGHTPITFLAATGDEGAYAGADWPASSPNVVAVGGTTLQLTSTGAYSSESAWNGSGGGYSTQEAEPTYQTSAQKTGVRTTPDVAIDADPNSGYAVYTTTPSTGKGAWQEVGGTSASTQVWAGIVAIVDQGRVLNGGTTLNGATQTLPALYALSSADFHDVTSGSNGYRASTGYDLATGLGSPVLNKLIPDLVAYSGTTTTTGGGTTTTGGGTTTTGGGGTTTGGGGGGGGGHRHGGGGFGGFGGSNFGGYYYVGTPSGPSTAVTTPAPYSGLIPISLGSTTVVPQSGTAAKGSTADGSGEEALVAIPQPIPLAPSVPPGLELTPEKLGTTQLYDLVLEMLLSKMIED